MNIIAAVSKQKSRIEATCEGLILQENQVKSISKKLEEHFHGKVSVVPISPLSRKNMTSLSLFRGTLRTLSRDKSTPTYGMFQNKLYGENELAIEVGKVFKSCTHGFQIDKTIKYHSSFDRWYGYRDFVSQFKNMKPSFILKGFNGMIIPILFNLKIEKVEESDVRSRQQRAEKVLKKWNHFDSNSTFLYSGKSRGLYEHPKSGSKVAKLAFSIVEGDVVIVVDSKLTAVNPPRKYFDQYSSLFETLDPDKQVVDEFHFLVPMENWAAGDFYMALDNRLYSAQGSIVSKLASSPEDVYVGGWIQVLAGGTHGWMKITQKTLKKLEEDFVIEKNEKWESLSTKK